MHHDEAIWRLFPAMEELHYYLEEIAHIPVLSVKEEHHLIEQLATAPVEQAQAARTRLIEAMLPLVVRLTLRTRSCGIERADLIQEGNLAVVEAMQTFDPQRRQLFRCFAMQAVYWRLATLVEKQVRERELRPRDDDSGSAWADEPSAARFLSLEAWHEDEETENALHEQRLFAHQLVSGDDEEGMPDARVLAEERWHTLVACVRSLPMKEGRVLLHRYLCGELQTLATVGHMLGISPERVRQLERRGLQHLRHSTRANTLRSVL